jgi:hypothetical protein
METTPRIPVAPTVYLVVATAGILAVLVLLGPTNASGRPTADDCRIDAQPFLYAGDVFADATVTCDSVKGWIKVSARLARDGVQVATQTHRCDRRSSCETSTAMAADPPGDQVWCVEASGSVQGGRTLGSIVGCESQEF